LLGILLFPFRLNDLELASPGGLEETGARGGDPGPGSHFQQGDSPMNYIDGMVIAVPAANKDDYLAQAKETQAYFKEYGATRVVECWGDDVPDGKVTDFKMAVKAKPEEIVVFSWIEWPSKTTRDSGMKKMMEDPRMQNMKMPFDGQRMIYGGFQPILDS
jgi:uncharacterized protein YbaA (DUF1428 family)